MVVIRQRNFNSFYQLFDMGENPAFNFMFIEE